MKKEEEPFKGIEVSDNEPVYTSGVVGRLLGIPVWVLKQLDREEVVSPPRKKGDRRRLYSASELKRLCYIWYLIDKKGVNIQGLKVILKMKGEDIDEFHDDPVEGKRRVVKSVSDARKPARRGKQAL